MIPTKQKIPTIFTLAETLNRKSQNTQTLTTKTSKVKFFNKLEKIRQKLDEMEEEVAKELNKQL